MKAPLETLFTLGCDPYAAGAAALFDKAQDAVTQEERDLVKRVSMHIAAYRVLNDSDAQRCTGTFVHDEYTACPVHDRRTP